MLIGVPKEIKDNEYRVGLVPSAVRELTAQGPSRAGREGCRPRAPALPTRPIRLPGPRSPPTAEHVFAEAELIVKVKEPLAVERKRLRRGQVLFTYLHLAPDREQTEDLLASGCIAIAYETVTSPQGGLPLLMPMSEVAGRMAPQAGAHCLEKENGGRGVLLGGVPGVPAADVVVLGGGTVGHPCGAHRGRHGRERDGRRPQSRCAAAHRHDLRRRRPHRLFHPRRRRDAVPPRRPRHRHRAHSRRHGTQAHLGGDRQGDEAGLGDCRCVDRPGRLRRDLAPDHAFASDLCRR